MGLFILNISIYMPGTHASLSSLQCPEEHTSNPDDARRAPRQMQERSRPQCVVDVTQPHQTPAFLTSTLMWRKHDCPKSTFLNHP